MTKKTVFSAAKGFNGEYTALATLAALMPRRAGALRGVKVAQQLLNLTFMMISLRSDYNSRSFLLHHRRFRWRKLIGPYCRYILIANCEATMGPLKNILAKLATTENNP
jgi:hypothetical protein